MSHDHPSEPGLTPAPGDPGTAAIAAALAALRPVPARPDRDRTLFEAGRASARPAPRLERVGWPALAASLLAVVAGQAALLARRPEPTVVERVVSVDRIVPAAPPARLATRPAGRVGSPVEAIPTPAERVAWMLVRYGLDGLPGPNPAGATLAGGAPPARDLAAGALLQRELELVLNPGAGL